MILDLLTVAVLVWVGSRLVIAARRSRRPDHRAWTRELVAGLRPRHFLLAVPVFSLVLAVAIALVQVPGLDIGWWTAIGGIGNPVVGGTERTTGTVLEWLVPALFLTLLVFALPLLVTREEEMFRLGAEHRTRWRRVRRGVEFGLVHALIGIPIGVALALSIGGWYFTWAYLRGVRRSGGSPRAGVLESARSHLAYNVTILALVAVGLVLSACGGDDGTTSGPGTLPSADRKVVVTSTAFRDAGRIPRAFTCDGAGGPPPLTWSGAPSRAAAIYLVVADPDAPGGTYVHWILGPLPASATGPGTTTEGWRPPCPPRGDRPHHYRFVVYATDAEVDVDRGHAADTITAIGDAAVASGTLTGTYGR